MLRRTILLVALIATASVCAVPAASAVRSHPREISASSCTTVKYNGGSYVLYRRGLSCRSARRLVLALSSSGGRDKPSGYACSSGSTYRTGGYCERGSKHFGWHPLD